MNKIKIIASYFIALWSSYVFISSLFFKFDSTALEPKHIFSTIGNWMSETINQTLGSLFSDYGAILIGTAELIASLFFLLPLVLWNYREKFHFIGGLFSIALMGGAVFFHLFTPLGWQPTWKVESAAECHAAFTSPDLCTDQGLANAALSILILGFVMVFLNKNATKTFIK
jgi:hypothetical protein